MTVRAQLSCESTQQEGSAYLEGLADALTQRGMRTRLMTPQGRIPSLHVVNPDATALAEDIYAGRGTDGGWWFWWSWAERIGMSEDLDDVASRIARVLAPHEPAGQLPGRD
ncbi:MAG TPA: hypothetical protein VGH27_24085 [Streptosporangiaceae bacterium]|jgi:hypothetical protein